MGSEMCIRDRYQAPFQYQQQQPAIQLQQQQFQGQAAVSLPNQAPWVNQRQPQHGQFVMGIVGFHITDSGVVQSIYPGSDVLRYGIHVGDRVLGYNNHPFVSVQNVVDEAVGVPGSIFPITFLHNGQVVTLPIRRIDARVFQHFANWGYNHIDQAVQMDRSW